MGADRELYRIGVTPECPVHQITVGGHCFPRRTETVTGYGAETKRTELQGSMVLLADKDIEAIKVGAKRRVIRSTRGKKQSAKVYHKDARNYRQQPQDQEVSDFLYIKKEESNPIEDQRYATLNQGPGSDEPEVAEEAEVPTEAVAEEAVVATKDEKKTVIKRRGGRIKE